MCSMILLQHAVFLTFIILVVGCMHVIPFLARLSIVFDPGER